MIDLLFAIEIAGWSLFEIIMMCLGLGMIGITLLVVFISMKRKEENGDEPGPFDEYEDDWEELECAPSKGEPFWVERIK